MGRPAVEITGRAFGRWTVAERRGSDHRGAAQWLCRCVCGTERVLRGIDLRARITHSCGCLARELSSARLGHHNMFGTPEYNSYSSARARCTNPKNIGFVYYGGRGIRFRFASFDQFYGEVGPKPTPQHTIDRINNEGHYEPGNVRWATPVEQASNRRQVDR